jgi:hypothetical protein
VGVIFLPWQPMHATQAIEAVKFGRCRCIICIAVWCKKEDNMKFRVIISIVVTLLMFGCAAVNEEYEEQGDLFVYFSADLTSQKSDSAGNILEMEGNISELSIVSDSNVKTLELVSTEIHLVETGVLFVDTTELGELKLVVKTDGAKVWMKPSQRKKFDKLP